MLARTVPPAEKAENVADPRKKRHRRRRTGKKTKIGTSSRKFASRLEGIHLRVQKKRADPYRATPSTCPKNLLAHYSAKVEWTTRFREKGSATHACRIKNFFCTCAKNESPRSFSIEASLAEKSGPATTVLAARAGLEGWTDRSVCEAGAPRHCLAEKGRGWSRRQRFPERDHKTVSESRRVALENPVTPQGDAGRGAAPRR